MRSLFSPLTAGAVLVVAVLVSSGAVAQTAVEPVTCAALTDAPPARLIESCTARIEHPATGEGDRLDAMITRAAAYHGSGQTEKALAEIDTVISLDSGHARAYRARGEILRQIGRMLLLQ